MELVLRSKRPLQTHNTNPDANPGELNEKK